MNVLSPRTLPFHRIARSSISIVLLALLALGASLCQSAPAAAARNSSARLGKAATNLHFNSIINVNMTSQLTHAKPEVTFCNGRFYTAWASIDSPPQLYIGYSTTPGQISTVVPINDHLWQFIDMTHHQSTGPSIVCWKNSPNGSQLYVAFTGTNNQLYVGYFDGNPSDGYLNKHSMVSETSNFSPALTVQPSPNNTLRIAWTGTDGPQGNSGTLNIKASNDGQNWILKHTWNSQPGQTQQTASSGPGFAWYCPSGGSCNPYIGWAGTDTAAQLNIGYFNLNSGLFVKVQVLGGFRMNSHAGDDVSMAASGSTIYMSYSDASGYGYIAIGYTQNPAGSWTVQDDIAGYGSVYGVGVGVDPSNGNVWSAWLNNQDIEVTLGQWTF